MLQAIANKSVSTLSQVAFKVTCCAHHCCQLSANILSEFGRISKAAMLIHAYAADPPR